MTQRRLGAGGGSISRGLPATHDRPLAYYNLSLAAGGDQRPTPERRSLPIKGDTMICLGSDGLYEFLGSTVRGAD